MDMSLMSLIVMGILTSVVMAGLFQTVTSVVKQRVREKPSRR